MSTGPNRHSMTEEMQKKAYDGKLKPGPRPKQPEPPPKKQPDRSYVMKRLYHCPKVDRVCLDASQNIAGVNARVFEWGKSDLEIYLIHPYLVFMRPGQPPDVVHGAKPAVIRLRSDVGDFFKHLVNPHGPT